MTVRRSTTARTALTTLVAAGTLVVSCFAFTGSASATAPTAAGGFADAYGLAIDAALLSSVPVVVAPVARTSATCPATKAPTVAQALAAGDPAVAHMGLMTSGAGASCTAATPTAMAKSQVMNMDAMGAVAAIAMHADAITAISTSGCAAAPGGSVNVVNLTLGGAKIVPDGMVAPNTKVLAPVLSALGLTVILNEQHPTADGRGFVVNGLHIIAAGQGAVIPVGGTIVRGDVVVSHALSGVACAGGPGTTVVPGAPGAPDITFTKTTSQDSAQLGDTFTYTATVTNTSATACEVLRFVDHVAPAFSLVSTAGAFGTALAAPAPTRADGGPDAVLHPKALVIGAKKTVVQTFTVKVNPTALPGTYYDTLELFCAPNGNFASGPLAPVTIDGPPPIVCAPEPTATCAPPVPLPPVITPPVKALPRTGGSPLLALGALVLLGAGVVSRKVSRS